MRQSLGRAPRRRPPAAQLLHQLDAGSLQALRERELRESGASVVSDVSSHLFIKCKITEIGRPNPRSLILFLERSRVDGANLSAIDRFNYFVYTKVRKA